MKKITFEIPSGYALPEGLKSGDTYDASVTLKVEDDGKRLCLTALDGIALPGYEEETEDGRKANPGAADAATQADFTSRYMQALGGAAG